MSVILNEAINALSQTQSQKSASTCLTAVFTDIIMQTVHLCDSKNFDLSSVSFWSLKANEQTEKLMHLYRLMG